MSTSVQHQKFKIDQHQRFRIVCEVSKLNIYLRNKSYINIKHRLNIMNSLNKQVSNTHNISFEGSELCNSCSIPTNFMHHDIGHSPWYVRWKTTMPQLSNLIRCDVTSGRLCMFYCYSMPIVWFLAWNTRFMLEVKSHLISELDS